MWATAEMKTNCVMWMWYASVSLGWTCWGKRNKIFSTGKIFRQNWNKFSSLKRGKHSYCGWVVWSAGFLLLLMLLLHCELSSFSFIYFFFSFFSATLRCITWLGLVNFSDYLNFIKIFVFWIFYGIRTRREVSYRKFYVIKREEISSYCYGCLND